MQGSPNVASFRLALCLDLVSSRRCRQHSVHWMRFTRPDHDVEGGGRTAWLGMVHRFKSTAVSPKGFPESATQPP